MFRRIVLGASALALAAAGLGVASAGVASAGKPTITAGAGSSLSCTLAGKVKISPKLKNDWKQSAHTSDSDANVRAIPDTRFSGTSPVSTAFKGKGNCTGTATDGFTTIHVTSIKATLSSPGTADNTPATCASLVTSGGSTVFAVHVTYKGLEGKVNPTDITIHGQTVILDSHGAGFQLSSSGTDITGSFAGGSSTSKAYVDQNTINAFSASPASSAHPVATSPQCEASLKIKPATSKHAESVSLVPPKGFGSIVVGPTPDTTPSSLSISR